MVVFITNPSLILSIYWCTPWLTNLKWNWNKIYLLSSSEYKLYLKHFWNSPRMQQQKFFCFIDMHYFWTAVFKVCFNVPTCYVDWIEKSSKESRSCYSCKISKKNRLSLSHINALRSKINPCHSREEFLFKGDATVGSRRVS